MSKLLYFVSFAAGAAIGAFAMHHYIYESYIERTQEEVDSVKRVFESKLADAEKKVSTMPVQLKGKVEELEKKKLAESNRNKPSIIEYADQIKRAGYVDYAKTNTTKPSKEDNVDRPIVIAPDVFGEDDSYTLISLTYYEPDGILADENDDVVDDIEETVGEDFADYFGDYEEDSVYIQNDSKKCYYEILRSYGEYEGDAPTKPKPVEIKDEHKSGDD